MKKLLSILAMLALVLSLCAGMAMAAESGEIIIDWQPASLGDDPKAPEYSNVPLDPVAAFAAEHPEEYAEAVAELEQWAIEEGLDLDTFDPDSYLAEALPMAVAETDSVKKPSDRRANDAGDLSHYYTAAADSVAVGDQTGNTCWAVAAMDCLRIGEAKNGRTVPTLDPAHLVYYAYHGFTDSLCNSERDKITPDTEDRGNVYASLMTLASWAGPAATLDKSKDKDIYANNALWLENGYWLSLSGSDDRKAVKSAVQEYGAVAVSMIAAGSAYYNADTCAYCYTETNLQANYTDHEVVIVGWDDDYSLTNFNSANRPAANGAWLCRNTWGSEWGDDGYFWLSYYDTGLCQNGVAVVFDASDWGKDKNIYQYDCSYTLFTTEKINSSSITIANVYTCGAADHELLTAVGTYTTVANTAYTVEVYADLTDPSDPRSGQLAASGSGTFTYAGYQTHSFAQPPCLDKNKSFSVIYTLTFPTSGEIRLPICASATSGDFTTYNSANAGESFRLTNGAWVDRSDKSGVNYRIKAITEAHTHNWNSTTETPASCTAAGQTKRTCSCGTVEYDPITKLNHTLTHVEAKAATTLSDGNIEYWQCSECKGFFSDSQGKTSIAQSDTVIAALGFTDVAAQKYYYPEVMWAAKNGIAKGMTDTEFWPYDYCTRAQIVTFLWRCAGEPEPALSTSPFTDVRPGSYYYKAVLWAAENGIAKGITATSFHPHEYCIRADMITFLWRAAGCPTPSGNQNPFTDIRTRDYFYSAVLWASEQGIAKGVTTTTFVPNDYCQRCQAVLFLYRTYAEE